MEALPEVVQYLLIFIVGILSSFINVNAGGGSAISVGLLTLLGVPVSIANGTNRVGVFTAGVSSVKTFRRNGKLDVKGAIPFALLAIIGSILGAYTASVLSPEIFKKYLAVSLLFVISTLFIPKASKKECDTSNIKVLISYPLMLLVGFYGGFIQAGVGFLIMALYRHLQNLDLVQINARKMLITTLFTFPAILIFAIKGQINWGYALVLAVGNYLGATIATKASINKGDTFVKYILAIAMFLIALKFFNIWQ